MWCLSYSNSYLPIAVLLNESTFFFSMFKSTCIHSNQIQQKLNIITGHCKAAILHCITSATGTDNWVYLYLVVWKKCFFTSCFLLVGTYYRHHNCSCVLGTYSIVPTAPCKLFTASTIFLAIYQMLDDVNLQHGALEHLDKWIPDWSLKSWHFEIYLSQDTDAFNLRLISPARLVQLCVCVYRTHVFIAVVWCYIYLVF